MTDGRLAVRPGDADDLERTRGMLEELGREWTEGSPRLFGGEHRPLRLIEDGVGAIALDQQSRSPGPACIVDKIVAIRLRAPHRHEEIAGVDPSGVDDDVLDFDALVGEACSFDGRHPFDESMESHGDGPVEGVGESDEVRTGSSTSRSRSTSLRGVPGAGV